jgi:hypothetical protein
MPFALTHGIGVFIEHLALAQVPSAAVVIAATGCGDCVGRGFTGHEVWSDLAGRDRHHLT